jgi:hypothetical protein
MRETEGNMKDKTMSAAEWRTVQFFLSTRGVYEVSIDLNGDDVRCTCEAYELRSSCKHTRIVVSKARRNNGVYPLKVSSKATEDESMTASESSEAFREFVIQYGYIEV